MKRDAINEKSVISLRILRHKQVISFDDGEHAIFNGIN